MSVRTMLPAALTAVLAAAALAGCSSSSGGSGGGSGGDIASVNGEAIPRSVFVVRLESSPQAKSVLNQLIQAKLIDQYAKQNNINITSDDIKKKVDELRSKYQPGQFDAILKQQNISDEDLNNIIREQLIVERAVDPQINVTDADVAAYLKTNHAALDTPDQVRARHILVRDKKTADEVEQKLKGGMKFEDAVKQYSQDPGSKEKGGELGFFSRTQMVPQFSAAAFSQPIGVVGPPVQSPFGFHIILVEEKKPGQIATLANSKDKIVVLLKQQQEATKIPVFMNELRNKAKIEIADDKLKDVAAPPIPPGGAPPQK